MIFTLTHHFDYKRFLWREEAAVVGIKARAGSLVVYLVVHLEMKLFILSCKKGTVLPRGK